MKNLSLLVCLSALSLTHCALTSPDTASPTASDLEKSNGGLTATAEAPDFGAPAQIGADPLSTAGADTVLPPDSTAGTGYHVVMLWGHAPPPRAGEGRGPGPGMPPPPPDGAMPPPPDGQMADGCGPMAGGPPPDGGRCHPPPALPPTDWSGSIAVQGASGADAAVSVRRTLHFEGADAVAPRTDPRRVEFVSQTELFSDGMVLAVRTMGSGAVLHVATTPYTGDFDLAALAGAGVQRANLGMNAVQVLVTRDGSGCEETLALGRTRRGDGSVGELHGRTYTMDGVETGAVRGLWGERADGSSVVFGKQIAVDGAFEGMFQGAQSDGTVQGAYSPAATDEPGRLEGRLSEGRFGCAPEAPLLLHFHPRCAAE